MNILYAALCCLSLFAHSLHSENVFLSREMKQLFFYGSFALATVWVGYKVLKNIFPGSTINNTHINSFPCIRGSGRLKSITIPLSQDTITGLDVGNTIQCSVSSGQQSQLHITADDNIIDHIDYTINNHTLLLTLRDGSYSNCSVRAAIALSNSLHSVTARGAAKIELEKITQNETLTVKADGTSEITINCDPNHTFSKIDIDTSGSSILSLNNAVSCEKMRSATDGSSWVKMNNQNNKFIDLSVHASAASELDIMGTITKANAKSTGSSQVRLGKVASLMRKSNGSSSIKTAY